uniref:Uncharacterized protein n=1 Tax=Odontella aurita TaxID=265563 RepID=A0A7S4KAQ6_9STRA
MAADKIGCDGTETSDGDHCSWCSSDMLQKSFCTTADAGDAMKQFIQDLECDSDSGDESPIEVVKDVGINPGDMMKCIRIDDKDGCGATAISDEEHCVWCTSDRLEQKFCVIPEAADGMKRFIQDLECGDSAEDGAEDNVKVQ